MSVLHPFVSGAFQRRCGERQLVRIGASQSGAAGTSATRHGVPRTRGLPARTDKEHHRRRCQSGCPAIRANDRYFTRGRYGLFVLLYEIPVRVHFKQGFFAVRFDEHLVIPLPSGSSSLYTLTICPPAAFSLIVFWTDAGSDFRSTFSLGCFPGSADALKVSPDANRYRQDCFRGFHSFHAMA